MFEEYGQHNEIVNKEEYKETKKGLQETGLLRKAGAIFIYIIYCLTLFEALKKSFGTSFYYKEARELVEAGVIDSIWEYGWGDHYILFFISFCFSIFCSAILSGATAKKRGDIIASVANIPILFLIGLICYLHYTDKIFLENPTGWGIILPLSFIGSCYLALKGGKIGEQWQNNNFSSNTIFGIRPIHWCWLIFPLNLVILTVVPKVIGALALLAGSTASALSSQTKDTVLCFLMFIAVVTSLSFIIWGWYKAFRLLSVNSEAKLNKFRIALSVLFYLFGIPIFADVLLALLVIAIR